MELGTGQPGGETCRHFSIRGFVADVRVENRKECWPFPMEEQGEELPSLDVPNFKFWLCEKKRLHGETVDVDESILLSSFHSRELNPTVICANGQLPNNGNTPELLSDSQQNSREKTFNEIRDDRSVCVNNVKNNTPLCSDTRDGPQQLSKEECIGGETADCADNIQNNASLCINVQEGFEVREDDYPSTKDDLAAVKDNRHNEDKDGVEKYENEDTCSLKGCDDSAEKCVKVASPELMVVKRKWESMADGGIKKACNKKPGFGRTTETKLNHKSKLPLKLDKNECRIDNEKRGNHQIRKKARKRKMEDILKSAPRSVSHKDSGSTREKTADLAQAELEQSGSGSESSLGFDLNRSPTHQVVKEQNKMDIEDEDEEPLQIASRKDVAEKPEDAAARDQQATFVNDGMCVSHKKKGKAPQYEGRETLPMIAPDDTLRGVQTVNGNALVEYNRAQHSDFGNPIARQSEGGLIHQKRKRSGNSEFLGGKRPRLPPKIGSLPQMETGSSSLDQQLENLTEPRRPNIIKWKCDQGTNKPSEQEDSDDIPMEVVELMAKNQYERRFGASGNSDHLLGMLTNNVEDSNQAEKADVIGTELLRFLHVEKFQKQKCHSIDQGYRSSTETMRVGSNQPTQATGYVSQNIRRPNGIISLAEQSHASRGFTSSPQNLERPLSGTQLLLGTSNKVSDDKNSPFSRNPEIPSSQAPFLAGSSCRDRNFTFSKNQGNLLNGSEFLFGNSTSSRNFANQSSELSKDLETPSTEVQLPLSGPSRVSGNQNLAFSHHRQKAATGVEALSCSSSRNYGNQNHSWSLNLAGDKHSQSSLTPETGQTSETVPWQNSFKDDRHAWPSVKSDFLPLGNRNSENLASTSSATDKHSQCLNLFPRGNMRGDHGLKSIDLITNQHEKRKRNLHLNASRRTHPEYPFGVSERRYQFNLHQVRPVDLCNNDKIPATQLLRLMDAGMSPSRPIDVDDDGDLTPHPSMPHQQRDVSRFGHSKDNGIFFPPSSNFLSSNPGYGKFVGNSSVSEVHEVGPTVPTVSASNTFGFSTSSIPRLNTMGSLLQTNDIIRKDRGSSSIYPAKSISNSLKDRIKGKAESMASPQSKSSRSNKALYGNGDLVKNHDVGFIRRDLLSNRESMSSHAHSLAIKDSTNHDRAGTVRQGSRSSMIEPCIVNMNPADFTVPEAGSKYMRGYGDFRLKEKVLSGDVTGLIELVGNKRQKKVKLAAIKDK